MPRTRTQTQKTDNQDQENFEKTMAQEKPILLPKEFTGQGNVSIEEWVEDFEIIANINQWEDKTLIRFLPAFLKENARTWYQRNCQNLNTWKEVKKALIESFTPPQKRIYLLEKLHKRNQRTNESVEDYAQEIMRLCMQLDPKMRDIELGEYFFLGLQPHLKSKMQITSTSTFTTLKTQAQMIEHNEKDTFSQNRSENQKIMQEELNYLRREVNRLKGGQNRQFDKNQRTRDINEKSRNYSWNSQFKPNNEKRSLPQYNRNSRDLKGNPICYNCKKPGHNAAVCYYKPKQFGKRQNWERTNLIENEDEIIIKNTKEETNTIQNIVEEKPSEKKIQVMKTRAKINQHTVHPIVDTGSSITIISEELVEKLLSKNVKKSKGEIINIRVANGETLNADKQIEIPLEIEGKIFKQKAVIIDNFAYDILIGNDFLKRFKAVINLSNSTMKLDEIIVPISVYNEKEWVMLMQDEILSPRSETVLIAWSEAKTWMNETSLLFEPRQELAENKQIFIAKSIISTAGKIPVRICNPTDNEVKLFKNTRLGIVETCTIMPEIQENLTKNRKLPKEIVFNKMDLNQEEKNQLKQLLESYVDIFAQNPKKPGITNQVNHQIHTGENKPINLQPYRTGLKEDEIIRKEIKEMLENDIIEPSISPWSAPVVLVKKKDGKLRFCVDYRKLNKITEKDVYPLPRIDDTIDMLAGSIYFSTLDLASGYWQIPVAREDRIKTAFKTKEGLYQFKVMPFGLCNAPATFQRAMDQLLAGLKWNSCLVYIDDIVIFSKTFAEHLQHLKQVFERIRKSRFHLKAEKCSFGKREINYLGHVISKKGIYPDLSKLSAIQSIQIPKNAKQIQQFLGLCGYYRRFIQNFAQIAEPLTQLTRKSNEFIWTPTCQKAFEELKSKLQKPPILVLPNFKEKFHISTDASNTGIGAILGQIQNNHEIVISYASRTLNQAERNYSTTERECLAVVWAIQHFRPYLYGQHFKIFTDHRALRWLQTFKANSSRLTRWNMELQGYDFEIIHKSGKNNSNADALSRINEVNVMSDEDTKQLIQAQMEDEQLKPFWRNKKRFIVQHGLLYRINTENSKTKRARTYQQLVIPSSMREEIMRLNHDDIFAGHLGLDKTYNRIQNKFWWPKCYRDVKHWVESCMDCCSKKNPKIKSFGEMVSIPVGEPFEMVGVDVVGPLPESNDGNKYLVVFTDYLTKWPEAFAVPSQDALTIAKLLVEEIICRHGAPKKLLSDRGKNFLSDLIKDITKIMGIKKLNSTAYHPQTDGLTERFNKTLIQILSMYVSKNQKDWDTFLPFALFAYRTSIQDSTKEMPFYLMYGREPNLPYDITSITGEIAQKMNPEKYLSKMISNLEESRRLARENIIISQHKQKRNYDNKGKPNKFEPGDLIWLWKPSMKKGLAKKFIHQWNGPYMVLERINDRNYRISHQNNKKKTQIVHISRMKKFIDPNISPTMTKSAENEQNEKGNNKKSEKSKEKEEKIKEGKLSTEKTEEFEVEKIIGERKKKIGKGYQIQYKIRWKGYGPENDTWEPLKNLSCPEKLFEYQNSRRNFL